MKPSLIRLTFALFTITALSAEARAQTTACNPPCLAGDQCVDGRCYTNANATPAAEPGAPAVPPAPVVAPAPVVPPPAVGVAPPPARHRARRRPVDADDADETATKADDDNGLPPRRRGMLVMPFLGVHSVQGLAAEDFNLGARGGLLLGVHVDSNLSLNVEAAVDLLSPQSGDSTISISGDDFTLAFSPLFHAAGNSAELVVGPKIGFWSDNFTQTDTFDRTTTRASQWGWAFGANLGVFANVNEHAALGLLLSYQFIAAVQTCTHGPMTTDRMCSQSGAFPPELLGITAAGLF